MLIDRVVFALSGAIILICITLSYLFSSHWLILAAIVGLNMVQAGFTGFCPIAVTLRKLGLKSHSAFS
ncbi:MAG TPA: DUF2892 domain-containing protein [Steroidobacteraceae bacterium]|nr:DUF2892 domain-containing protein [Steroidobacteraceae bacterium]